MQSSARRRAASWVVIGGLGLAPTASHAFDPAAYLEFLDTIRDQTTTELLDEHAPFGPYTFNVPEAPITPEYLDSISVHFALTEGEHALLGQHGFMVSERLSYPSYGAAFEEIWHADLPVFVSTDAILHALHRSYVDILGAVEEEYLSGVLDGALDALHAGWPDLNATYGSVPGMREPLDDVDTYLTVARSLLRGVTLTSHGDNQAAVAELLAFCYAEAPASYPLFNVVPRLIDFSQLTPRGHYAGSAALRKYFRSMMWLGRTAFRLTSPGGTIPPALDVSREIVGAFLVRELVPNGGAAGLGTIDELIRALVGAPDNVTLIELDRLAVALDIQRADELLDPAVRAAFTAELTTGDYTAQGINSQILIHDPMNPGGIVPPYAFLLMGQRFIIDSYVTGNVVYDAIEFEGSFPFRGLPDPFDVLFAIGNDDVLPFLEEELDAYHYAANLSALRYLIDGYEPGFWRQSLYTVWLQAIRTLSATGREPDVPEFMKTGAWQQEKMNTQLASWTELRHDNLLYAKQSYTGGAVCSYPRTYVEPVPGFYRTLQAFAADAAVAFAPLPPWLEFSGQIAPFFANMGATMSRLAEIAEKELSGEPFTAEEIDFLSDVLYFGEHCVPWEGGWYRDLYFSTGDSPTRDPDLLIADVHTQPTDEQGAMVGHVLHAATGAPEIGVFVAAPPGQPLTAFAGPVASFHEYTTMDFERLTDEEWAAFYASSPPTRPDWTFVYLADGNGDVRPDGPKLVDGPTPTFPPGASPPGTSPGAAAIVLAPNRPNPFNGSTVIAFRIGVAGRPAVTLRVFDVRGREVAALLDEPLRSGTYVARWDGTDDRGARVESGVYVAELRVGEATRTQRMTLVK